MSFKLRCGTANPLSPLSQPRSIKVQHLLPKVYIYLVLIAKTLLRRRAVEEQAQEAEASGAKSIGLGDLKHGHPAHFPACVTTSQIPKLTK